MTAGGFIGEKRRGADFESLSLFKSNQTNGSLWFERVLHHCRRGFSGNFAYGYSVMVSGVCGMGLVLAIG